MFLKKVLHKHEEINRPEAIYGQRYPCPAHQHCNGSFEVGRASDPKGTMSCRIQGESVLRPFICPSVSPSICPEPSSGWLAGWGGDVRTDRWMDVRIDSPSILQDIVSFGSTAHKEMGVAWGGGGGSEMGTGKKGRKSNSLRKRMKYRRMDE